MGCRGFGGLRDMKYGVVLRADITQRHVERYVKGKAECGL